MLNLLESVNRCKVELDVSPVEWDVLPRAVNQVTVVTKACALPRLMTGCYETVA